MNQQNDSGGQRQAQGQSQSQSQSQSRQDAAARTKGMHPGSDRDDYGSPHGEHGVVATYEHERERLEPGQVERGDSGTDSGAPAGYGDRGRGGKAPQQGEYDANRYDPGRPARDQQEGVVGADSAQARQAEQGESHHSRSGYPRGDYDND